MAIFISNIILMLNMTDINEIKLDKVDRRILIELDKNCRIPSTKLARLVHKSRQAVDYRINNLVTQGAIIGFQTSINPHKMGRRIYKVYLKIKNVPEKKEKLVKHLKSSAIVYWLGECSGTWDLILAVFAKSEYEFFEFKNEFISTFGDIIIDSHGEPLIDVKQYTKTYLLESKEYPTESVMFGGETTHAFDSKSIQEQIPEKLEPSETKSAKQSFLKIVK